jgi:glycosyltransferase involved in cell wall biosynthesis
VSTARKPRVVVFSTLFPTPLQPQAGVFIRERMFRVARFLPLTVVSPVPWFPFQSLIRRWRPNFRPEAPRREIQSGIEIVRPRFFSVPGLFKRLDGFFLAIGSFSTLLGLKQADRLDLLDAHFAYPDGYAATLLGRWLQVPVTVTLRGAEARQAASGPLRKRVATALRRSSRVFAVAAALKRLAVSLGIEDDRIRVIGNGVDLQKFRPVAKSDARAALRLPQDAPVLVSVGGLVERKGFHRVIECLPSLLEQFRGLHYLIVGGPSAEGDIGKRLSAQVETLGLQANVHFTGALRQEDLKIPLSAANVFVLATRNEGWANVFLEAMACGLPIVTTDVGGNAEVVSRPDLGIVVPFDKPIALREALRTALQRNWDQEAIMAYAHTHDWDSRIAVLVKEFEQLAISALRGAPQMAAGESDQR